MHYEKKRITQALLLAFLVPAAYAQTSRFTTMSAGNWTSFVAPDSIAAGFGVNIAASMTVANSLPLGTSLGNVSVSITDSAGTKAAASIYMASPQQVNYLIPAGLAVGRATVTATSGLNTFVGPLEISNVAPAIFAINMEGNGVAAAQIIRVSASGQVTTQVPYQVGVLFYVPTPISLSPSTDQVYLILYGTGIRHHSANPVKATINGVNVPVLFAGAQSTLPGLDQVNLGPLPQTLAGTGKPALNISILVDGIPTNTTTIGIQ